VLELTEPAPLVVFCPFPAPELFPVPVAPAAAMDLVALELFAGGLVEADAEATDVELFPLGVDVVVEPDDELVEPVEPEAGLPSAVTAK